jgi:hypothetical protein
LGLEVNGHAPGFLCYHSNTMTRRRLILYILLNALVSILVTGVILMIYDSIHQKTDCGTSEIVPTLTSGSVNADIVSVGGAGTLSSESVLIQNSGEEALVMTGWKLRDSQGSTFTFPQLTIYPGGRVQVLTRSGTDSAADLYWKRSAPVWETGELAALYDTQNIARAFYRVP